MNQRQIGALLVAAGGAVLFVGGLLSLTAGSGEATSSVAATVPATPATTVAPSTTASAAEASTTTVAPTTTSPTTTLATTTTAQATTTTTEATTTPTIAPTALVEMFIADFAAALADGDVDRVFASLHPALVLGFGEELCRGWVEAEIMGLGDYTQVGPVVGPTTGSLETPGGTVVFEERYTVDIMFTFSGAEFSTAADYVLLDGVVYFTGTCR